METEEQALYRKQYQIKRELVCMFLGLAEKAPVEDVLNTLTIKYGMVFDDFIYKKTKSGRREFRKIIYEFCEKHKLKTRKLTYIDPTKSIFVKKKKKRKEKGFYFTSEWRELRYKALLLHGRKCMCCGAAPPYVTLHVDHIKPRSKHPELQLDISNLQVLCEDCNLGKSNKDKTDFRPMLIKGGKE